MTWPIVPLTAAWVLLVAVRAAERRPARRVTALLAASSLAREARSDPSSDLRPRRPPSSRRRMAALTAVAVVLALATIGPVGAALVGMCVPVLVRVKAQRTARAQDSIRQARLPDAVDLLVVAGSAGLAPRQAMALVAERGPPELRPPFAEVVARAAAGEPWAHAVSRLVATIGEPARALVNTLVSAEQDGAPMGEVLGRLADDARRQRRNDLEAAVRRLPVRLSFPLVCCCLPAFVLLTVVPLVAAGLRRLGPVAL